jgi:cephalosporin hydroxylase
MELREYWLARAAQHTTDSYLGVPLSKFPEDLRVYEHLLWRTTPDVVVELGGQAGGSALWFRDRLRTLAAYGRVAAPRVVSVDLDVSVARANLAEVDPHYADSIVLLEGDVQDPALRAEVGRHLPAGAHCMVVEDSAHVEATTRAALELYSDLVPPGGLFVVEDGCVDVEWMRLGEDWPRGVLPALRAWLATPQGAAFRMRRELELYGVSCHPEGFLERVA